MYDETRINPRPIEDDQVFALYAALRVELERALKATSREALKLHFEQARRFMEKATTEEATAV